MNKLRNLGLAFIAGKTIIGTDYVVDGLRKNKVELILLANDSSENTIKKITDKSSYYKTPIITKYTSNEISQALGKKNIKVVGITESGFSKLLLD